MRVLLTFPPVASKLLLAEMRSRPPMGIYTLAGALRKQGIDAKTLDPIELERFLFGDEQLCNEYIKKYIEDIDVIGVSCNSYNWGIGLDLIKKIKMIKSDCTVIVGGIHASLFPEHVLESSNADLVVAGEGEVSFPQVIRCLEDNINPVGLIPGVYDIDTPVHKINAPQKLTLDEISSVMPAYDLIPSEYDSISVESSRGCLHNCVFCAIPFRGSWRGIDKSIVFDRFDNAFKNFHSKHRIEEVFFCEDCITTNPERVKSILNRVESLGCNAIFQGRLDNIIEGDFIETAPWDIVKSFQIGIECGYDEGLKRVAKGLNISQIERTIMRLAEAGAQIVASFVIGFPWEDEDDYLKTIHFAASLASKYGINISTSILGYYPSSTLWKTKDKYNIVVNEKMFDDPLWMFDLELFYKLHPNLNEKKIKRIESTIDSYAKAGCRLVQVR